MLTPAAPSPAPSGISWGAHPGPSVAPATSRTQRLATAAGRRLPTVLGLPLIAAIASAIAASPWLRAFSVPGAAIILGLAAVIPIVVAVLAALVARQAVAISYAASLLALVALVAVGLSPHPAALASILAHEPTRLLTETLPLRGGRVVLIAPVLVVWVIAAATGEVLARSRRSAATPVLPVISYLIAFAVTAGAPGTDEWTGPALLGAVALLALAGTAVPAPATSMRPPAGPAGTGPTGGAERTPGKDRLRRGILGAALAAVVVAALAYSVPHIGAIGGRPASLARHPQVTSQLVVDPVDAIGALRDSNPTLAARSLLTVTTSAPSTGYFGIATLDNYNGDTWSFDTTFRPTGGRVPVAPAGQPGAATPRTPTVRQSYALLPGYGLPFIPTLDRPELVSGVPVDLDPSTGMVVPAQPLTFPSAYSVVSGGAGSTFEQLSGGDAIDGGQSALAAAPELGLPPGISADLSSALRFLAGLTHQRPAPTVAFLQALMTALHHDFRRVDPALNASAGRASVTRGGTSLAEVINAITVGRRATPEQFATLFVLVARDLGVPARLVTGFRVQPATAGSRLPAGPLPAGTVTVTDRQAWTWAEIPVEGLGWVVADPTPTATASSVAQPSTKAKSTPTTVAPRQARVVPIPALRRHQALAPPVQARPPSRAAASIWARGIEIAAAIVALFLLIGPGLAAGRRYARRRRRRRGPAPGRAARAWLELLDGLDRAGLPVAATATATEVAHDVGLRFGDELTQPVTLVATVAERAVCCQRDPPDDATATTVWNTQRAVCRHVRRHTPPATRLRAVVRVGPAPRPPSSAPAASRRGDGSHGQARWWPRRARRWPRRARRSRTSPPGRHQP